MLQDVAGLPKIKFGNPSQFFANVEKNAIAEFSVWVGELYFERHRGCFTSQGIFLKSFQTILKKKRSKCCAVIIE